LLLLKIVRNFLKKISFIFPYSAKEEKEEDNNGSNYERISSSLITNIQNKSFLFIKIFDFSLTIYSPSYLSSTWIKEKITITLQLIPWPAWHNPLIVLNHLLHSINHLEYKLYYLTDIIYIQWNIWQLLTSWSRMKKQ